MSKKIMLLALSVVSAALFALPAMAQAGEWEMTPAGGAFEVENVGNTTLTTSNNETVTCVKVTGNGSYNVGSTTTGTIGLTFHECTTVVLGFKVNCTGTAVGEPTGTIKTTAGLEFTNEYLTDNKTTPGIRLKGTGVEEHFATFKCSGVTIKVTGTIFGRSELPCATKTKTHQIIFESTEKEGEQKFMQITGTGEKQDLTANVSGTNRTASQDGTGKLKFGVEEEIKCV